MVPLKPEGTLIVWYAPRGMWKTAWLVGTVRVPFLQRLAWKPAGKMQSGVVPN
jgi:hypothetical protein